MNLCKIIFLFLISYHYLFSEEIKTANSYDYTDCKFEYLKSKTKMDCIVEELDGHDYNLYIYDIDGSKIIGPTHKISVPSWFNFAKLKFDDLLGEGKKMIFIQVEGVVGKNLNQELLFIFHYQENDFKPVLFETVSYNSGTYLEKNKLEISLRYKDYKSKRVSIFLDYTYSTYQNGKLQIQSRKLWSDELVWDYKNLTFYDLDIEKKKLGAAYFYIEKNIYQTRLEFPEIQGKDFKKNIFKSKIFQLLVDKKS